MIRKVFIIIFVVAILVAFCSFVIRTVNFEELFQNSEESENEEKDETSDNGNNSGGNNNNGSSSGSTDTGNGNTGTDSGNTGGDSSDSGNTGNEDETTTFNHHSESVIRTAYIDGAVYNNGTADCFEFSEMNYLGNSSFVYSVFEPLEITDDIHSFSISFTLSGGSDGSCVGLIMQPIFRDSAGTLLSINSRLDAVRNFLYYDESLDSIVANFYNSQGMGISFVEVDFPTKFEIVFLRESDTNFYYRVYLDGVSVPILEQNIEKVDLRDVSTFDQYRFYMVDTGNGEALSIKDFKVTYTK